METLLAIVQTVGLPTALVIFFVWHGHREKTRLADRLASVEDFQRGQLVGIVERASEAATTQTLALREQTALLQTIARQGCGHRVADAARRVT